MPHNNVHILHNIFLQNLFRQHPSIIILPIIIFIRNFNIQPPGFPTRHTNPVGRLHTKHQLLRIDVDEIVVAGFDDKPKVYWVVDEALDVFELVVYAGDDGLYEVGAFALCLFDPFHGEDFGDELSVEVEVDYAGDEVHENGYRHVEG
jgi:hypothetical protein